MFIILKVRFAAQGLVLHWHPRPMCYHARSQIAWTIGWCRDWVLPRRRPECSGNSSVPVAQLASNEIGLQRSKSATVEQDAISSIHFRVVYSRRHSPRTHNRSPFSRRHPTPPFPTYCLNGRSVPPSCVKAQMHVNALCI